MAQTVGIAMIETGDTIVATRMLGMVPESHEPGDFSLYIRTSASTVRVDRSDTDETIVKAVGFAKAMTALANHYGLPVVVSVDPNVPVTAKMRGWMGTYSPTLTGERVITGQSGETFRAGDLIIEGDTFLKITAITGEGVIVRTRFTGKGFGVPFNSASMLAKSGAWKHDTGQYAAEVALRNRPAAKSAKIRADRCSDPNPHYGFCSVWRCATRVQATEARKLADAMTEEELLDALIPAVHEGDTVYRERDGHTGIVGEILRGPGLHVYFNDGGDWITTHNELIAHGYEIIPAADMTALKIAADVDTTPMPFRTSRKVKSTSKSRKYRKGA
jgi:hypothetical protein